MTWPTLKSVRLITARPRNRWTTPVPSRSSSIALPGANALAVERETLAAMQSLSKDFPPDMTYTVVYDPTEYIAQSVWRIFATFSAPKSCSAVQPDDAAVVGLRFWPPLRDVLRVEPICEVVHSWAERSARRSAIGSSPTSMRRFSARASVRASVTSVWKTPDRDPPLPPRGAVIEDERPRAGRGDADTEALHLIIISDAIASRGCSERPHQLVGDFLRHQPAAPSCPRHVRAMSAPCPRHVRAMSAPCPRHVRAMSAPCPRTNRRFLSRIVNVCQKVACEIWPMSCDFESPSADTASVGSLSVCSPSASPRFESVAPTNDFSQIAASLILVTGFGITFWVTFPAWGVRSVPSGSAECVSLSLSSPLLCWAWRRVARTMMALIAANRVPYIGGGGGFAQ